MATEILYNWGPGQSRLALVRDGRLADMVLLRPHLMAGCLVAGRVVEVANKLGAVFVDIGQDRPAFLQGVKGLTVGATICAQVKSDPQGGKGAALTVDVVLPGRFMNWAPFKAGISIPKKLSGEKRDRILERIEDLVEEDEGVLLRMHAATAPEGALEIEIEELRATWAEVEAKADKAKPPALLWRPCPIAKLLADNPGVSRILVDDRAVYADLRLAYGDMVELHTDGPIFDLYDVEEHLMDALSPVVPLPCGGRVIIEQTSALTAIDVDSGPATGAEANTQAVGVIARQLRLRNIGGQILVDFVSGGGKGALLKLTTALKQAVQRDSTSTHVIGTTPLGLMELTRERRGPSLAELMVAKSFGLNAESSLLAGLAQLAREAAANPAQALRLRVSRDLSPAVSTLNNALLELEARLARKVELVVDDSLSGFEWRI